MASNPTLATDTTPGNSDDETNAAIAALDAAEQAIRATRKLLTARAKASPDDGKGRRLTLDDLVARKIVASRRVGRERVKAGELRAEKVGRELFFTPTDVEDFLAARAVKVAPPASTTPKASEDDELDQALAKSGLRIVGSRR